MKFLIAPVTAVVMAAGVVSYPGMKETLNEITARAEQAAEAAAAPAPPELIGDLLTLQECKLTPTGAAIKHILLGTESPQDTTTGYPNVPAKDTPACAADTCCIWKYIADDLKTVMTDGTGRCTQLASGAIRLGFHDAATWSKGTGNGGGADGSMLLAGECEARDENAGLGNICAQMRVWYDKYKGYGISMADLIQFSSNLGAVLCPIGPRVRTFVGRKDSSAQSPANLLPSPSGTADEIIALFADKTITPQMLIALLGAHSVSEQFVTFPAQAGAPQDSTPGVLDNEYYRDVLSRTPPSQVVRFVSDLNLAADSRTQVFFGLYGDQEGGQQKWNTDYARAYIRLSLLGVYNINDMTECTKALPPFTGFTFP